MRSLDPHLPLNYRGTRCAALLSLFVSNRIERKLMSRCFLRLLALCLLLFSTFACSNPETPKPECTTNGECQLTQRCDKEKCVAIVCQNDTDCRGGYECSNKACAKPEECPEKDVGGCCQDRHCKANELCVDKKCVEKGCSKDADCIDKEKPKCLGGKCATADSCRSDGDCPSDKPSCQEGTCAKIQPGKEGEKCDSLRPCDPKLVCYSDVGQKFCRQPCDPFNAVCSIGRVCAPVGDGKGVCIPRNNGRGEGESCLSNPCEKNLYCVSWSDGKDVCAKPCRKDKKDCNGSDICYDLGTYRACVPEPVPCGPGRACETDWDCVENKCLPKTCPRIACAADKVCRAGSCEDLNCCKGDKCPTGKSCNHQSGVCMEVTITTPFCGKCLSGNRCASKSQRCIELTSKDDKLCARECTASKTCGDSLMECKPFKDKRWFCVPKSGTCDRNRCDGVTCKPGQLCLPATKACITLNKNICAPCTNDIECGGPTDRCLIPDGKSSGFCGRDCSGCATCPNGYACKDQAGGKQCVPADGACK